MRDAGVLRGCGAEGDMCGLIIWHRTGGDMYTFRAV